MLLRSPPLRLLSTLRRPPISISPDVSRILNYGGPVVALESTIISHGMPFPANLDTARMVEDTVRSTGATPATIGVLDGQVVVGMSDDQLKTMAEKGDAGAVSKVSRRDLPVVMGAKTDGATTVSATMLIAHKVGIDVFVTGGIGGVHRGAESTMDVSADLMELGRTPVAVVCAGVKSILDIDKTLEVLETQGVTVVGLGCDSFPAFFTPASHAPNPNRLDDVDAIADVWQAGKDLDLGHGMVVAVPNTGTSDADASSIDSAIKQAVQDARVAGVTGKEETPFLLRRVNELTGGASLRANIAAIKNNALVGGRLAVAVSGRRHFSSSASSTTAPSAPAVSSGPDGTPTDNSSSQYPVVIGGAVVDLMSRPADGKELIRETSNPGVVSQHFGGVGRNIAEALARLETRPVLVSAVGADSMGGALTADAKAVGITPMFATDSDSRTAVYSAMLDGNGDLVAAVADMDAMDVVSPDVVAEAEETVKGSACVVVDGNLRVDTLAKVGEVAARHGVPLWFEPTSVPKAGKIVDAAVLPHTTVLSPNSDEAYAIANAFRRSLGLSEVWEDFEAGEEGGDEDGEDTTTESTVIDLGGGDGGDGNTGDHGSGSDSDSDEVEIDLDVRLLTAGQTLLAAMCAPVTESPPALLDNRKHVLVTMGKAGVLALSSPMCTTNEEWDTLLNQPFFHAAFNSDMEFKLYPAPRTKVVNVTGGGDTFVGGVVWALCHGNDMDVSVTAGLAAAKLSVQSAVAVPTDLHPHAVIEGLKDVGAVDLE